MEAVWSRGGDTRGARPAATRQERHPQYHRARKSSVSVLQAEYGTV